MKGGFKAFEKRTKSESFLENGKTYYMEGDTKFRIVKDVDSQLNKELINQIPYDKNTKSYKFLFNVIEYMKVNKKVQNFQEEHINKVFESTIIRTDSTGSNDSTLELLTEIFSPRDTTISSNLSGVNVFYSGSEEGDLYDSN